jgi:tetratricopeptide (TPR) repeat protein
MSLSVDKALRQAQSHLKAGELAEAEALYKQVLSKFPKNKKAIQGYQKLKAGITSKGSLNAEPPQEQIDGLISLFNQGRFEDVVFNAKPMSKIFPKAIILLNLMGASNLALLNHEAAIDNYQKVIKIDPVCGEVYYNLGLVLQSKGDFEAAIVTYQKAVKFKPDNFSAYTNMGAILIENREYDAAIICCKKAIQIKSDHASAYGNMGAALQEKGEWNAAIKCFKNALRIKPEYAEAYYNIGNVLKDKGELVSAIDSYKQALKINPDYAEAYNNMGNTLKGQGEVAAAIDNFKQALKIKPDFAEAYSNMGAALTDKGDLEAAVDSCKQALKIKPDYAEAFNNMGNSLMNKGDFKTAIGSYDRALKIKPDYAECFVNRGSLQLQISESNYVERKLESHVNQNLKKILIDNPKHQIHVAIKQFINGDYVSSVKCLQRYRTLVEVEKNNKLNKKDQFFCDGYYTFISSLIEKRPTCLSISKNKIYHVGESHCLSYARHKVTVQQQTFSVSPMITFGAKAYHFTKLQENSFKSITRHNLDNIPNSSVVLISFGEIDCRANEGLIRTAQKTKSSLEEIVQKTVNGYINWFLAANENNKHSYNFLNVPAPVYKREYTLSVNKKVANVIRLFNDALRRNLLDHSLDLIDVYRPTANETYFSNNLYHCDFVHLDNRILGLIEEQIRLERLSPTKELLR